MTERERPQVYLLETGSLLDKMLRFFLTRLSEEARLSEASEAEVAFLDYDAPRAREALSAFRRKAPTCPVVAFALKPPDPPLLHFQKPVTLEQLERFLQEAPWRQTEVPPVEAEPEPGSTSPGSSMLGVAAETAPVWELHRDGPLEELYEAQHYLQGPLESAWRCARTARIPVRVVLKEGPIYLFPREGVALLPFGHDRLVELCRQPLKAKVEAAPEALHMRLTGERLPVEALIWQVALFCSRGRLERRLTAHERFFLRRWPNFTRWPRTPYSLAIAALLFKSAAEIEEVAEKLGVPREEVQAFLSAAAAISFLDYPKREEGLELPSLEPERRSFLVGFLRKLFSRSG